VNLTALIENIAYRQLVYQHVPNEIFIYLWMPLPMIENDERFFSFLHLLISHIRPALSNWSFPGTQLDGVDF
jgi:hypothetical protein